MAKSEFICAICDKVCDAGWFKVKKKYKCPNHKVICGTHVSDGFFTSSCKECGERVQCYKFTGKKWMTG